MLRGTSLADAKLIVPPFAIWVAVLQDEWKHEMAEHTWNDMLSIHKPILSTHKVRFGMLSDLPKRKGWVYRPLESYKDFTNQSIVVFT